MYVVRNRSIEQFVCMNNVVELKKCSRMQATNGGFVYIVDCAKTCDDGEK